MLAKTCQDVAQQGENKGRSKELTEQANSPDFSFFLNFFPDFSKRHKLFFIFFTNFLYFSLNKDHKRCNHKNWHLQLRWDVVYRNSARSLKSVQKLWQFFFFIFLNFFGNFDETKQGEAEFGSGPNGVKKLLKKFQIFLINERKVMPVLPKVSQGMFSGRHNTAAAVRAKRPETLTPITGSSLWLTAVGIRLMM